MSLIIFAILLFYMRIFPNRWMRLSVYGVTTFTMAWVMAMVIVVILQCTPVQFFWDRQISDGHCIKADPFYFATGITSTVTLITVLFLPMPIIWKLQVSSGRKLGLAFTFTIGALYVKPSSQSAAST